ncbi:alpha/beta hydrolase [Prochlorococcus marinus]|uniref:alpha/beta hydrolase n=1 Tax=Prochlorococcus marinus TaxID=1219 RepID=UPI0022B3F4DE|nr:alpha/beta fold hydrolase [Prochlorococcus marinus]
MEEDFFCITSEFATHRLILLHGWGADADDLLPLGENLANLLEKKIEIISLRAPEMHPQGFGRQWYGLFPADWKAAKNAINDLLIRLKTLNDSRIPLDKTVLLGFSQGGAMALAVGCELPLAGLIGCSAYPHPDLNVPKNSPLVFLSHGQFDEIVPIEASRKLLKLFEKQNNLVEFHCFDGGHEIPQILYENIRIFLESCFK